LLIRHTRPNIHRNYRKTIVAAMPSLNYLDDMPVFPKDRRYAVAFIEGGVEAERRWAAVGKCTSFKKSMHQAAWHTMEAGCSRMQTEA
jgi:hypothetical protein